MVLQDQQDEEQDHDIRRVSADMTSSSWWLGDTKVSLVHLKCLCVLINSKGSLDMQSRVMSLIPLLESINQLMIMSMCRLWVLDHADIKSQVMLVRYSLEDDHCLYRKIAVIGWESAVEKPGKHHKSNWQLQQTLFSKTCWCRRKWLYGQSNSDKSFLLLSNSSIDLHQSLQWEDWRLLYKEDQRSLKGSSERDIKNTVVLLHLSCLNQKVSLLFI